MSKSLRLSGRADRVGWLAAVVLGAQVGWFALPSPSSAGCTNIPVPPVEFGGRRGSIDRAFIARNDTVRITIDTPGDPTAKTASAIEVDRLAVRVFVKPLTKGAGWQLRLEYVSDGDRRLYRRAVQDRREL